MLDSSSAYLYVVEHKGDVEKERLQRGAEDHGEQVDAVDLLRAGELNEPHKYSLLRRES